MDLKYLTPGVMTGLGRHGGTVAGLSGDLAAIARAVQGVLLHEGWAERYGVTLTAADRTTVHLRRASDLLDAAAPDLSTGRPPGRRVVTHCRSFAVVTVALLRAHGLAARARCGFATYFEPGRFADHWVVEYRDRGAWRRADTQLDDFQRRALGVDFDVLDLPAEAFVAGPDAWRMIRDGTDPELFGLGVDDLSGAWFVAGNVLRDVAARDNVEVLPWDMWAPMPEVGGPVDVELIDRIAAGSIPVTVPDQVYSNLRERMEPLLVTSRP
jgi:hypothetical protein